MARTAIPIVVLDSTTNPPTLVAGAAVVVQNRIDATPATVFAAEIGGGTRTQPLSTDLSGRVDGWLNRGAFIITITIPGRDPYSINHDSAPASDGGIDTVWIVNGGVTSAKIATDAVTAAKILDGTVGTSELANLAVTTGKLADGAVTSLKIADGTIQAGDIGDAQVTTPKVADGAITGPKVNADNLLPWTININPIVTPKAQTNWNLIVPDSNYPGGGYRGSAGTTFSLSWDVVLAAGNWTTRIQASLISPAVSNTWALALDGSNVGVINLDTGKFTTRIVGPFAVGTTGKKLVSISGVDDTFVNTISTLQFLRTS